MEQRDYLMKQFEQLGIVLAALLGFKSRGEYKKAFEVIAVGYKEIPGFDPELLYIIDPEEFLKRLLEEVPVSYEKLSLIADFLFEEGDFLYLSGEKAKSKNRLLKALEIFKFLNVNQKVFSMERETKISRINQITKIS